MTKARQILALDYGDKRIGWATADTSVPIAVPQGAVEVNGQELEEIIKITKRQSIDEIVVGYPRNQSGEPTAQTAKVEQFVKRLEAQFQPIVLQDESLTSVIAEDILNRRKKPFQKADVDALAAALILDDYLGVKYGAR